MKFDWESASHDKTQTGKKQTWTLQLKENVTVTSSIVRVGDVIEPVDVPESQWQALRLSTIGLVPTDGRPLRLMRYRLAEALTNSNLLTSAVLWVGPESTSVRSSPILQVAATTPATFRISDRPIDPLGKKLIERAVEHAMQDAKRMFKYEIDWERIPSRQTDGITSYQKVSVPDEISVGTARFVLAAQIGGKIREIPVHVKITDLPKTVIAARNLSRGQILSASDIKLEPITNPRDAAKLLSDPKMLIGQALKQNVSAGRMFRESDYGPPILVQRNDMVEVMVVGGAVVIRTGAKALSAGSDGDLIQVETIEGRKRLLARVVGSGLVEIVTRSPQVR